MLRSIWAIFRGHWQRCRGSKVLGTQRWEFCIKREICMKHKDQRMYFKYCGEVKTLKTSFPWHFLWKIWRDYFLWEQLPGRRNILIRNWRDWPSGQIRNVFKFPDIFEVGREPAFQPVGRRKVAYLSLLFSNAKILQVPGRLYWRPIVTIKGHENRVSLKKSI